MEPPGDHGKVRDAPSLGERVWWLIRLRWLAIAALFGVVTVPSRVFHVRLETRELYLIGFILTLLNVVFFVTCRALHIRQDRGGRRVRLFANLQITTDLLVLAALIHYSGGIENPFALYFIFHIIVSGSLLSPIEAWLQAVIAILLFCGMVSLERIGVISHHHVPGLVPAGLYQNSLFVMAVVVAFASTMCLAVFTVISISRLVRQHQQQGDALIGQLQQAYSQLHELERSKSRYMHRVSHELRSPLGAIQNLLAMVEETLIGEGGSSERELVARASRRIDQALKLTSDLLTLARSQDARFTVTMKEVSLSEAICEVVGSLRPRADKQGVALTADVPIDLPTVSGDAESIAQLFTNLMANAIKYTPAGGRVEVSTRVRDDHVVVTVADTGIGIPGEDLPYIFDEFYRGKNARQFADQGTGLGLSIVKSIADLHGAEVRVTSELGRGTTFELTVPRADARAQRTEPAV